MAFDCHPTSWIVVAVVLPVDQVTLVDVHPWPHVETSRAKALFVTVQNEEEVSVKGGHLDLLAPAGNGQAVTQQYSGHCGVETEMQSVRISPIRGCIVTYYLGWNREHKDMVKHSGYVRGER